MVLSTVVGAFLPHEIIQQASEANQSIPVGGGNMAMASKLGEIGKIVGNVNWWLILGCFIFYFIVWIYLSSQHLEQLSAWWRHLLWVQAAGL